MYYVTKIRKESYIMDNQDKDTKTKIQFWTDEQLLEEFKQISSTFSNQEQAFRAFMDAYKVQEKKESFPDQRGQLDKLESSLNSIKSDFIYLIETYNGTKDAVRVEFQEELEKLNKSLSIRDDDVKRLTELKEGQEQTIKDLQADLEGRQAQDELLSTLKEQNATLKEQLKESQQGRQQAQKELADLEQRLIGLDEELKGKQSAVSELQGDLKAVKVDLSAKQTRIDELNGVNADLKQSIKEKDLSLADLIKSLTEANKRNQSQNNKQQHN